MLVLLQLTERVSPNLLQQELPTSSLSNGEAPDWKAMINVVFCTREGAYMNVCMDRSGVGINTNSGGGQGLL